MTSMIFLTLPYNCVTISFLPEIWFWGPTHPTFLYNVTLFSLFLLKASLMCKISQYSPTERTKNICPILYLSRSFYLVEFRDDRFCWCVSMIQEGKYDQLL